MLLHTEQWDAQGLREVDNLEDIVNDHQDRTYPISKILVWRLPINFIDKIIDTHTGYTY